MAHIHLKKFYHPVTLIWGQYEPNKPNLVKEKKSCINGLISLFRLRWDDE